MSVVVTYEMYTNDIEHLHQLAGHNHTRQAGI